MQEKIHPDLQFSVVCDDVRQEANGKFILIGLFDVISGNKLPVRFPRLCVVNRWCGGDGTFTQVTRIVRPDQSTVLASGREIPVKLKNIEATATNVEVFGNLVMPDPGAYWVEIIMEGELRLRYPLRVVLVAPPAPPGEGRSAPHRNN
ncbi:MAG: hypothetical protein ABR497_06045 [Kiritimatiellia bacterium]|nr:hypothetical protein [Lentisphaerota bacterium]